MKRSALFLIIILLSVFFVMPAHATIKKVAQTGLQFLKIDVGARAAAMGGTFLMVGDDANAMFYNPAGIAKMSANLDFFTGRTQWIADINYNAAGLVKNFGKWGNVGVSFISSDYGDIIGTRVAATDKGFEETGNVDVIAGAVGLAYARQLTSKFTLGGQIKYAYEHLGDNLLSTGETVENKVSGLAYDFGTIFYPGFKSLRVGMSIRNFSPQFKYEEEAFELPLIFRIGAAMDIFDLLSSGPANSSFLLAVDALHPRDYTERIHIGGEFLYADMVALRAGYKINYDEEDFSLGVGIKYNIGGIGLKVDYAYTNLGIFDAVNRFSVGFSF